MTNEEALVEQTKLIRLNYIATAGEEIFENVLNSLSAINLNDPQNLDDRDIILLKETIISLMSRLVGVSHPLHQISHDIIDIKFDADDDTFYNYTFKVKKKKEDKKDTEVSKK